MANRPVSGMKRDTRIDVPLSQQERQAVEKIAREEGTSAASVIRRSLLKDLRDTNKASR